MKVQPFLMFEGKCEEAMNFHIARIPGSRIIDILRYGKGQLGAEGSIMRATFCIGEQIVVCNDGRVKHPFTFTPSSSFFIQCETDAETDRLAAALGEGGAALMPLGAY